MCTIDSDDDISSLLGVDSDTMNEDMNNCQACWMFINVLILGSRQDIQRTLLLNAHERAEEFGNCRKPLNRIRISHFRQARQGT